MERDMSAQQVSNETPYNVWTTASWCNGYDGWPVLHVQRSNLTEVFWI